MRVLPILAVLLGACAIAPRCTDAPDLAWLDFSSFQQPDVVVLTAAGGGEFELHLSIADAPVVVARVDAERKRLWSITPSGAWGSGLYEDSEPGHDRSHADSGTMALDGTRLFVVEYSGIASGAIVTAFDTRNGDELWCRSVHGLGKVMHSRYGNEVIARMVGGALILYGNEAAGRYIEVYSPAGEMLSNRTLPRLGSFEGSWWRGNGTRMPPP